MAPPVALRPYSVPCGPMVLRLVLTAISFMCVDTPASPVPLITSRPMPRMLKLELPKLVAVKVTLGAFNCRSDGLMTCLSSSMLPVSAVTAMGTSWMLSAVRWAVTITSSMALSSASAVASEAAQTVPAPMMIASQRRPFGFAVVMTFPSVAPGHAQRRASHPYRRARSRCQTIVGVGRIAPDPAMERPWTDDREGRRPAHWAGGSIQGTGGSGS